VTEFRTRPYAEGDAAAVAALMNAVEVDAGGSPFFTDADIRRVVDARVRDLASDSRLTVALDGTLVAAGFVVPPPDGGSRADTLGGVHPLWQGRGLGHALLDWQIKRLSGLHDEIAPDARWDIEAGTLADHEGAIHLFENFDMSPARFFLEMRADLATALAATPRPPVPEGIRVAPYTPEHVDGVYRAHMDAFADHWGFQGRAQHEWVQTTVDAPSFRPDLSRVAFDGDDVAGYVLSYDAIDDLHHIGQVGTRRPWRRRGLASALVVDTMAAAADAGKATATLGVDADSLTGAVGVYERVGFSVLTRFVAYRRPLGPEVLSPGASTG